MKIISLLPVGLVACFPSCTNITMLGHVAAYDVNAEFKGDPVTPVGMNAGFESHSFVAVPPEQSGHWRKNFQHDFLPKGDVLPTISKLKIEGIGTNDALGGIAFDFVSSGATGEAAIAAAGGTPQATGTGGSTEPLVEADKATELGEQIEAITKSPAVIPVR